MPREKEKMMRFKYTILTALLLLAPLNAKGGDFVNTIGMVFKTIPAGSFMMGSKLQRCPVDDPFTRNNEYADCMESGDQSVNRDETPYHNVNLKGFYMSDTEVTQLQYFKIMGENRSQFLTEELGYDSRHNPVENVSWDEAKAFVRKLNKLEKTTKYRLPTEAEWEYASKAGTGTKWSFGDDVSKADDFAWHAGNSKDQTHPVGQKRANPWGLYDMHGNVWEWCEDWYVDNYDMTPIDGSANHSGPKKEKILRGGSWIYYAQDARSAIRSRDARNARYVIVGFRIVRDLGGAVSTGASSSRTKEKQQNTSRSMKDNMQKYLKKRDMDKKTKAPANPNIDDLFGQVAK